MKYPSIILSLACTAFLAACSNPSNSASPQPETSTPDTTRPTIAAINPVGGTGAATALEVSATDAGGIQKVEFWQGSAPTSKAKTQATEEQVQLLATDTSTPYRYDFISSQNGTRNYHVRVFDSAGNVTVSQTLSLTVNITPPPSTQPAPDTLAPTALGLLINYGANSDTSMEVAPGFTYSLAASGSTDNTGIAKVVFYQRTGTRTLAIDELTQAPYTLFRQEVCDQMGSFTAVYSARAFDATGNASPSSNEVVITYQCGK